MKNNFNNFIKKAKIKQKFYVVATGYKHIIRKIGKNKSWTNEYSLAGTEIVEWNNDDRDQVIY